MFSLSQKIRRNFPIEYAFVFLDKRTKKEINTSNFIEMNFVKMKNGRNLKNNDSNEKMAI